MALIGQRDFAGALREGEGALKADSKHPGAHQLAGTLYCQLGQSEKGVPLLERSLALAENQTTRLNLAKALLDLGRLADAEAALRKAAPGADTYRLRGDIAKQSGNPQAAIAAYREALRTRPDYADVWNNLGNTLREIGDLAGAIDALDRAGALNPRSATLQVNRARALSDADRTEEAFQAVQRALTLAPNDPQALLEAAKLHALAARYDESLALLRDAQTALSADADFWIAKGLAHAALDAQAEAEAAYRRAITLAPRNALAWANLGFLLEAQSRLEEANKVLDEAATSEVESASLQLLRAALLRRRGDVESALSVAEAAQPDNLAGRITRAEMIAQCADRMDDAPRAFAAMTEMNALKAQAPDARGYDGRAFARKLSALNAQLTPDWIASWRPLAPSARPAPVLLLGFPRSGTTLLDTMLRGHPRVAVLEELPMMEAVNAALGDPTRVASIDDAEAEKLRTIYFQSLAAQDVTPGRDVVIDKLPFHIADTVLIHRLFPDARFIFALRHPCDVVLSCFMQNFHVNFGMAAFLDLANAAELYDRTMTYWRHCTELLPLNVHTLRYEDVVADAEGQMRAVLGFLDVAWDDAVLAHQKNAAGRTRVRTPSYWQVTEKLYTRASGRWRRYRDQLAPVLPLLQPWAARFGYD